MCVCFSRYSYCIFGLIESYICAHIVQNATQPIRFDFACASERTAALNSHEPATLNLCLGIYSDGFVFLLYNIFFHRQAFEITRIYNLNIDCFPGHKINNNKPKRCRLTDQTRATMIQTTNHCESTRIRARQRQCKTTERTSHNIQIKVANEATK